MRNQFSENLRLLCDRTYAIDVLVAIRKRKEAAQSELIHHTSAHQDTISQLLVDLTRLGLIARKKVEDERFKGKYSLTKKGEKVLEYIELIETLLPPS